MRGVTPAAAQIPRSNGYVPSDNPLSDALNTYDYQTAIAALVDLELTAKIPQGHFFNVLFRVQSSSCEHADALFDRLLESPYMHRLTRVQIDNLVNPFKSEPPLEQTAGLDLIAARMARFLATDHAQRVSLDVLVDLQNWEKSQLIPNLDDLITEKRQALSDRLACFGKKRI